MSNNHTIIEKYTIDKREFLKIKCNKHDEIYNIRFCHYKSRGCMFCNETRYSFKRFVDESNIIHNNKFKYHREGWKNNSSKVLAECPNHGMVTLSSGNNHLSGRGCNLCRLENSAYTTKKKFKQFCDNHSGKGTFYILKCYNEYENFYKYGITSRTIKQRYWNGNNKTLPYNYKIEYICIGEPYYIYDIEKNIKRRILNTLYSPMNSFNGSINECSKTLIIPEFY